MGFGCCGALEEDYFFKSGSVGKAGEEEEGGGGGGGGRVYLAVGRRGVARRIREIGFGLRSRRGVQVDEPLRGRSRRICSRLAHFHYGVRRASNVLLFVARRVSKVLTNSR